MSTIPELLIKYGPANEFDMGVYTIVVVAIISRFIYYLSKVFSPLVSRHYVGLTPAHQADWDSRTVSTIHAIVVTYLSYYCLFFDGESAQKYHDDPVHHRNRLGVFTQCIIGGYLINDTVIVWSHRKGISAVTSTIFHHLLALSGILFVLFKPISLFYPLVYALSEASTPFVNFRWWFYSAEKKQTKRYLLAGLLMTLSFFVIRMLLVPYMVIHSYYRLTIDAVLALPWPDFIMTVFFPLAGNALNVFWFVLIFRGLLRAISSSSSSSSSSSKGKKQQ